MKIIAEHLADNPHREDLVRGLVAYNRQKAPPSNWRYVGFYALDDDGQLVGGVQGNFEWDWLHITHLWVKEAGQGLGRELMECAESYAREEGKRGIYLDTFEFQARPFYEKLGFTLVGTIEKFAGESARYFMQKHLR